MANVENNYVIINSHLNRSNGGMTNSDYIERELRRPGSKLSVEEAGRMLDAQERSARAINKEAKKVDHENKKKRGGFGEPVNKARAKALDYEKSVDSNFRALRDCSW